MIELLMICMTVASNYTSYTVGTLTDIQATKVGVVYLVDGVSFTTDGRSTKDGYYLGPDCKFVN